MQLNPSQRDGVRKDSIVILPHGEGVNNRPNGLWSDDDVYFTKTYPRRVEAIGAAYQALLRASVLSGESAETEFLGRWDAAAAPLLTEHWMTYPKGTSDLETLMDDTRTALDDKPAFARYMSGLK
jgi:hypothetical protein